MAGLSCVSKLPHRQGVVGETLTQRKPANDLVASREAQLGLQREHTRSCDERGEDDESDLVLWC
jgi:hypothetical protein